DAEKERAADLLLLPVVADRLRDGEDVPLVEGVVERRAAVSGGPEGDPLGRAQGIRAARVVRRHEPGHVHQDRGRRRLSGERADRHRPGAGAAAAFGVVAGGKPLKSCARTVRSFSSRPSFESVGSIAPFAWPRQTMCFSFTSTRSMMIVPTPMSSV